MFNWFMTVKLYRIRKINFRLFIRSKLQYLLQQQELYNGIGERSKVTGSIIVKYKKTKEKNTGDTVLILRFINSASVLDKKLTSLHNALETILNRECSQPVSHRQYVEYSIIWKVSEIDDDIYLFENEGNKDDSN